MVSLEFRNEASTRKAATETRHLPHEFYAHCTSVKREIDLIAWRDSEVVAHVLRDHHLTLGTNSGSHTNKYNFDPEVLVASAPTLLTPLTWSKPPPCNSVVLNSQARWHSPAVQMILRPLNHTGADPFDDRP